MLASVHAAIDDRGLSDELRTPRQVAIPCQTTHETAEHTVAAADIDEETVARLGESGSLT